MYNLLIHGRSGMWEQTPAEMPADRFITYTHDNIREIYQDQSDAGLERLKALPALFAYEFGDDLAARAGWIRAIRRHQNSLELDIEFDDHFDPIPALALRELYGALDITSRLEPYNTHWAVKEVDLHAVLAAFERRPELKPAADELVAAREIAEHATPDLGKPHGIFIVHGRDQAALNSVARWVERIGLEAIVLSEQPNEGRAVIDKFRAEAARAAYAVVLLTPDDLGALAGEEERPRARQNVVFELGYFIASLGPQNVCALYEGGVEIPSDYDGVVYIPYDRGEGWKLGLARELQRAHIPFNANRIF